MNVEVSLNILEDIFRLLDYLDDLGTYDVLFFDKAGYSQCLEHDNAFWNLKLKIKQIRLQVVKTYLRTIEDITKDEIHDLHEWVEDGNSVYDNPYLIYDSSGRPMDFINACRFNAIMYDDFLYSDDSDENILHYDDCDDLPF